jgi:hypothetical protein
MPTTLTIDPVTDDIVVYINEGVPGSATLDGVETLTNKTLTSPKIGTSILDVNGNELLILTATASAVNELTYANAATGGKPTLTASGVDTDISINLVPKGTGTVQIAGVNVATAGANTFAADQTLGNNAVKTIKTATFNSQTVIATTTGAITVDWTAAQNQKQTEPTGTITYTFTAPAGPCHLQLLIDSDGTSTAQTVVWPGTVIWLGATWTGLANKKAVINFWYDGTSYYAIGTNQV